MTLTCCDHEGFCPTFQRELWGRIFRHAHGVDCTPDEHNSMREMLMKSLPEAPEASSVEVQQIEQPIPATQPKRPQKRKGCGCGRKLKPI